MMCLLRQLLRYVFDVVFTLCFLLAYKFSTFNAYQDLKNVKMFYFDKHPSIRIDNYKRFGVGLICQKLHLHCRQL